MTDRFHEDFIRIDKLEAQCLIGIYPFERARKQTVWLDLEIPASVKRAAQSDDIHDALDYKIIAKTALRWIARSRFGLIESLAEFLASSLIREFKLKWIRLALSKPGALRFSKNVSVHIFRTREQIQSTPPVSRPHIAYLSLGSNIRPKFHLTRALSELNACLQILRISSVYESSAVGDRKLKPFWNNMVLVATNQSPQRLKAALSRIEKKLGRKRSAYKFAPRTIDIDIVAYDNRFFKNPVLKIPRPESQWAGYILVPLLEIAPEWVHPLTGRTILEQMGKLLDPNGYFKKRLDARKLAYWRSR